MLETWTPRTNPTAHTGHQNKTSHNFVDWCYVRNTLILGQSLILTLKTSFSKQNNHISEESNQLLLDVVTWTAII